MSGMLWDDLKWNHTSTKNQFFFMLLDLRERSPNNFVQLLSRVFVRSEVFESYGRKKTTTLTPSKRDDMEFGRLNTSKLKQAPLITH
jgi:hypothetical protein